MKEKLITSKIPLSAIILLGMCMVLLLPVSGNCFTAMAQVDKTRITPEDMVSFQVVVDGGKAVVNLSPIHDFKIVSSGTSTSRSYSNGEWQHKVIYRYLLVPRKTGVLKIPPLTVSRKKQDIVTKEIQVLVSKAPSSADQPRQLFVEAHVASSDLTVGQQTIYTIKLFAAVRFTRASLKTPAFNPFAAKELEQRKNYTRTVNGIPYMVSEIYYILQAEKPGRFEIGPAVITADVIQRQGSNPVDSFFNDPFFSSARTKSMQVSSNGVTLGVKRLPSYTGDSPFSGLVGQFTIGAAIDKKQLIAGESATLTLTIQGEGNIMDAAPPQLNLDQGLVKVYDDTPTEEITATESGFSGKKIFKRALVPKQPGTLTIPAVDLTYFDVETGEYKTVATSEIVIDVSGSAPIVTMNSVADNGLEPGMKNSSPDGQKQEVVMVNRDILDIKDSISILSSPFQLNFFVFVLLVLAPGLIYGCFLFFFRLQTREKSNESLMGQRAAKSLKTAEKLAAADKPFLNHVQAGLIAAILSKADKQGESLTCDEARQILKQAGTEPSIIDDAVDLLENLDATRFGGQIMDSSKATLSPGRARKIIKMLSITLCCLGLFFNCSHSAVAGQDKVDNRENSGTAATILPEKTLGQGDRADITGNFIDGIRKYQAGEFKDAAVSFETIAASGVVNPDLFYNIGNAYLKANDLGNAILWYERAKRLSPGDPDLLFNLAHANTLVKDRTDSPVTLVDILFFWQGVVPLRWLQAGTMAFSCMFFLWAGVQTVRHKRIFSGPGWLLISLLLVLFLAAGMDTYRSRVENLAVIIKDEAAVRSGVMENSTRLFELHAGTMVQVKAQKNGYLKIRLTRGRVGWVKPGDAKVI